jgi:hypothetical protein
MQIGTPFNPFGLFVGSFIPNNLLRYPKLSPNAKLLWARLAQYAGRGGKCYPKQHTLSVELGISTDRVKQLVKELADKKFIRVLKPSGEARLIHATNSYQFLWHPALDSENATPEVEDLTPPVGADLPPPNKESHREENPLQGACGKNLRSFTDLFCQMWTAKYGSKYPFTKKDGVNANRIWRSTGGDWTKAKQILERYFADSSDFYRGHTISKLLSQLPTFMVNTNQSEEMPQKPPPPFLKDAVRFLRKKAVGVFRGDQLDAAVMGHTRWLSKAKAKTKRQIAMGKKQKKRSTTKTLRESFLPVLVMMNRTRFVEWIVEQVLGWEQWGGSFSDFYVQGKHWKRFVRLSLTYSGWTPNEAELQVLNEA